MDTTRPSLLLRIRDRNDAGAWHTFDSIYRPMLQRFAHSCGLGDEASEDVAQHCLTVIAERIGEFVYDPEKGRFKGWLRTMVTNRVRTMARGRHERQAGSDVFRDLPQREDTPQEVFDRIWLEEHLWHCLRELRGEVEEHTYLAFQYHVIDQWPVEKVCAELGLKPNNVYTIKWRLTQRVADKMRELLDGIE